MNSLPQRFRTLPGMDSKAIRRPWVFFANRAKESSIRRQLAERLSASEFVISVGTPISAVRQPWQYPFGRRICLDACGAVKYYPLHTPERVPALKRWLRFLNHRRLVHELNELSGVSPLVVCYDSPEQYPLVGRFQEALRVYLAVDDRTLKVTGEPISGSLEAERELLARVDLVVCVSPYLVQRLRERILSPPEPQIFLLPNGYDERIFDPGRKWSEPEALNRTSRPRILVAGHISERIDWEGITEACQMRPSWNWVFLGPADPGIPEKITRQLRARGHYFPPVPNQEVPAWIQHCDVCAAPYRLNSFTLTSDPLKVIEFLAMGAAVLATHIPSLGRYQGVIEWVEESDGASYAQALDLFEKQGEAGKQMRQKAVLGDTWQVRAEQLRALIRDWENRELRDPIHSAFDGPIDQCPSPRDRERSVKR